MDAYLAILAKVLPVFLAIGAGFFSRRRAWLTREGGEGLLRVNINLLFPCLIFSSILGNSALRDWRNLGMAPLVGFGSIVIGYAVALFSARWIGLKEGSSRRTFAFTVGMYNYSYIPIPLSMLFFSRDTTAVLFVHNFGAEVAMWLGAALLLGAGAKSSLWKKIINPPIVVLIATIFLGYAGVDRYIPGFAMETADWLGKCAIPLSLLLVGSEIAEQSSGFVAREGASTAIAACALRLAALPILFLAAAMALPVSMELKRVMILQAAMPCAVFPILLVHYYHGDTSTALRVVLGTSFASFATTPLWIRLGLWYFGSG